MVVGSGISDDIQKLVDFFDIECERFLDFDKKISSNEQSIRKYLDNLIENKAEWEKISEWGKIAVVCRRMIICDRELDLKRGVNLINNTLETFEKLESSHKDQPYEAIRYANTCGLIAFRRGDYSNALKFFSKAKDIASNSEFMKCFIPDTTSNIIRSNFDLFRYTLPQAEIKGKEVEYYKKRFEYFIKQFETAINEASQYQTSDEKLEFIFAHGMASLYHNLGEIYITIDNKKLELDGIDLKRKAKDANEFSLKWGKEIGDIYRQLQSINQLCANSIDEIKNYEEVLLKGKWIRGRQFALQRKVRSSENSEDINDIIKGKVKFDKNNLEVKDGLILDENYEDKLVLLYNYNELKKCLNNGKNGIQYKEGKTVTLLNIADAKIRIAEKLRDEFSFFLYRRQAINLIRDDVYYKIKQFWEDKNYVECINLSEDYNSRGLIELSQITLSQDFSNKFDNHRDKIEELKYPIYDQIRKDLYNDAPYINRLSLTLKIENDESILNLLLAYEDVLGEYLKIPHANNQGIYTKLIHKLKEIPLDQDTAVIRFWAMKEKEEKIRAVLITRDGIKKLWQENDIHLNIESLAKDISDLAKILESDLIQKNTLEAKQEAYNGLFEQMADFSEKLKLYNELTNIKNLFIIPDGKLLQLPLHLLGKDGQDLRRESGIKVYYCPTLYHLLTPLTGSSDTICKESKCLWLFCPTPDLYNKKNGEIKPKLSRLDIFERNKNNIILEYDKATFKSFLSTLNANMFDHIGFSTHGHFHDDSKEAYISPILLSDSFLTPYDVLFSLKLSGIQTIFIGACQVGSSKYTDENEAVGLVTAFLAKRATSVIASLWSIHYNTHDLFIDTLKNGNSFNSSKPWDLTDILSQCKEPYRLIPYVQYANIGIIERTT